MTTPAAIPAVQCDHEVGCVTCGDTAVAMRVLSADRGGPALCTDPEGRRERVETELVGAVEEGALLLVHAGVALQLLEPEEDR